MTRWNRPMRTYRTSTLVLRCAACGGGFATRSGIREEVRMVDGQIYHLLCALRSAKGPVA